MPAALFDTELAGRLLGYPRVGLATLVETLLGLPDAQGALGRRLVDAAAARALARVRRARRRGARRAARRARPRARRGRQGRVGPPGVRRPARASRRPSAREPWRRTSGIAPGPRPPRARPRSASCGRPATSSPASATSPPGRIIPRLRHRRGRAWRCPPTGPRCWRTKGFHGRGAQRYADRWVEALAERARAARGRPAGARPAADGPPTPRAWAERDPVAAERLTLRAGRHHRSCRRSSSCPPRTSSPPTPSGA